MLALSMRAHVSVLIKFAQGACYHAAEQENKTVIWQRDSTHAYQSQRSPHVPSGSWIRSFWLFLRIFCVPKAPRREWYGVIIDFSFKSDSECTLPKRQGDRLLSGCDKRAEEVRVGVF